MVETGTDSRTDRPDRQIGTPGECLSSDPIDGGGEVGVGDGGVPGLDAPHRLR